MVLDKVLQNIIQPDTHGRLGCVRSTWELLPVQVRKLSFHAIESFAKVCPRDLNSQASLTLCEHRKTPFSRGQSSEKNQRCKPLEAKSNKNSKRDPRRSKWSTENIHNWLIKICCCTIKYDQWVICASKNDLWKIVEQAFENSLQ